MARRRRATERPSPIFHDRGARKSGADSRPETILSAFQAIDALLQARGPFTAQGDEPDSQPIRVDWSLRTWWLRAISAIHDAGAGSEKAFELSCKVSGGDCLTGLVGCP